MTLKPLIAANWKMHGDMSWCDKPAEFEERFPASERGDIDVLICPPAILIARLAEKAKQAAMMFIYFMAALLSLPMPRTFFQRIMLMAR